MLGLNSGHKLIFILKIIVLMSLITVESRNKESSFDSPPPHQEQGKKILLSARLKWRDSGSAMLGDDVLIAHTCLQTGRKVTPQNQSKNLASALASQSAFKLFAIAPVEHERLGSPPQLLSQSGCAGGQFHPELEIIS